LLNFLSVVLDCVACLVTCLRGPLSLWLDNGDASWHAIETRHRRSYLLLIGVVACCFDFTLQHPRRQARIIVAICILYSPELTSTAYRILVKHYYCPVFLHLWTF